jgi:hypothetical protein
VISKDYLGGVFWTFADIRFSYFAVIERFKPSPRLRHPSESGGAALLCHRTPRRAVFARALA